ncbi:unnamed protein product [Arctia plantaginis]|uniref:Uncharacterized protein n=1 Tax=Arctia plantaginis TaxID=874455 RepID=A0A8S0Z3C7_ARCPL|nr:unnamed protein product [Arctia plantaginis]CAB3254678.1 unnamed protein product [Arctia plantaginis]
MEMMQKISCLVLLVFGLAQSSVLPVEKCTLTDKSCMITAVQKMVPVFTAGMPEIGVEVLDVMKMDDVKFELSGLQFSLNDGTLKGMKTAVIDDLNWDLKKKVFTIDFHVDAVVKGHYIAAGHLLILPINGDGQLKLKLKNLKIKLVISYQEVKNGEKDHFKLTKHSVDYKVIDNAHFNLSNLFNGNKELSEPMLKFMNENWKQIAAEFGKPLVDSAANKLYQNIVVVFEKLPIGDIANV